jgi:hypothetical protein
VTHVRAILDCHDRARAWLEGNAGLVHLAMVLLGLIVVFGDLIIARRRWREAFRPMPWQHSAVAAVIIGVAVYVGLSIGP